MKIRPAIRRRLIWAVVIATVLIAMVIGILSFVHVTANIELSKRCAPSIWQSQWPKWIGCTMGAHEGLAGGLVGAAGALFAAWLAFDAIQEQLSEERDRRNLQQAEAKEAAIVCIAPTIHAAAVTLLSIESALRASEAGKAESDKLVVLGATHVQSQLESFTVRESLRDLGLDDRLLYLSILGTLGVFVNISTRPSLLVNRVQQLETQRHALMNIHTYLRGFDPELARVYARDSHTRPAQATQ